MSPQAGPRLSQHQGIISAENAVKFRTVSRAMENDEGTDAAWGLKGSRGALFWIPRARLAILRREVDEPSGPKETEWKDRGALGERSATGFHWKKVTHPSRTAVRQRSCMEASDTEHSPSDRKIMTGALGCRNVKTKELHKGWIEDCEPLCAPVLLHHSLTCSESFHEIRASTSLVAKDGA